MRYDRHKLGAAESSVKPHAPAGRNQLPLRGGLGARAASSPAAGTFASQAICESCSNSRRRAVVATSLRLALSAWSAVVRLAFVDFLRLQPARCSPSRELPSDLRLIASLLEKIDRRLQIALEDVIIRARAAQDQDEH